MGSSARRAAGTAAAGLVALAGLGLLVAPQASGEAVALLLALAVGIGVLQVLVGLWLVAGDSPVEHAVEDRPAWGAGWVLDGVRAIGLGVSLWMLFAPGGAGLRPAGIVVLAAVIAAAPFARRLDRRAAPRLAPGTYVVRPTPTTGLVTLTRGAAAPLRVISSDGLPVPAARPVRHLRSMADSGPQTAVGRRLDTRL